MSHRTKTIDRSGPQPIWRQIYDVLLSEIRTGEFGAGGKLPSANELARRFGVNRHTVRQSLKALDEAGLTETRQGAGSFVNGRVVNYPISQRTRFSEIILDQGMEPAGEVLQIEHKTATKEIAQALRLRRESRLVMVERTCRADGEVVGVARHFFPAARFAGLARVVRDTASISKALRQLGIDNYFRRSTTVSARMPTSREGRLLKQPVSRPVLVSKAINVDEQGQPIEFGVTLFRTDRVRLKLGG